MKRIIVITIFAALLLLIPGSFKTVSAGVEPSPFRDEIGQMGSIINIMDMLDRQSGRVLLTAEDAMEKDMKAHINKLEALIHKAGLVNGRLDCIFEDVGYEITEVGDEGADEIDLMKSQGEMILHTANSILFKIDSYFELDPEIVPGIYEFGDTLQIFKIAVKDIVKNVNAFLRDLGSVDPVFGNN